MYGKFVFTLILLVGAVQALETLQFFERQDGDELLYTSYYFSNTTDQLTSHVATFDWTGDDQLFTQVIFDVSGWTWAQLDTVGGNRDHFEAYIYDETTQLVAFMTVYGFNGASGAAPQIEP